MARSAHRRYKKFPPALKNRVKEEAEALRSDPYICEELKGPLRGIWSYHFVGLDHRSGHLLPRVKTPGYYLPSLRDCISPIGATDHSPAIYCRVAETMIKATSFITASNIELPNRILEQKKEIEVVLVKSRENFYQTLKRVITG